MGDLNHETLAVIDEWLHSGDGPKFSAVLRLIRDAPKNLAFVFPYFAVHVVECASEIGGNFAQDAIEVFVAHAQTRQWQGTPAKPPEAMLKLRDAAVEMAEKMNAFPAGGQLFSAIARAVKQEIRRWAQTFEESE